jgi:hypothetical protein
MEKGKAIRKNQRKNKNKKGQEKKKPKKAKSFENDPWPFWLLLLHIFFLALQNFLFVL